MDLSQKTWQKALFRKIRKTLKLTQPELAIVLGRSFSTIRQYESGQRRVTPQILGGLRSLCVARDDLMDVAREIDETALGTTRLGDDTETPMDSHLHSLLTRIANAADPRTLESVGLLLEMCLYWVTESPRARDIQQRLELLYRAGSTPQDATAKAQREG